MMHSGTLLSKAEYALMDRWFQFASEYYKKYVQPDVIGKQTYSVIHNSIAPSKELYSKMALGEVSQSLP